MAYTIGRLQSIGFAKEGTRNTAETTASIWTPVMDSYLEDEVEKKANTSGLGSIIENNSMGVMKKNGMAKIGGKIFVDSVGLELTALYGQSPTSAQRGTSGVYDHTYTLAENNNHTSLTAYKKLDGTSTAYPGAVLDKYSLEIKTDDFVMRNFEMISKSGVSTTQTVAYTDQTEFFPKHVSIFVADDLAGLDAATAQIITSINIDWEKNAEAIMALNGTNDVTTVQNKTFKVSGKFTMFHTNDTFKDYVFNNAYKALRIQIKNTDVTIGGSHNPEVRFDFAKIYFEKYDAKRDADDFINDEISFVGTLSLSDGTHGGARLTNELDGSIY